jgi:hypothetical protein
MYIYIYIYIYIYRDRERVKLENILIITQFFTDLYALATICIMDFLC